VLAVKSGRHFTFYFKVLVHWLKLKIPPPDIPLHCSISLLPLLLLLNLPLLDYSSSGSFLLFAFFSFYFFCLSIFWGRLLLLSFTYFLSSRSSLLVVPLIHSSSSSNEWTRECNHCALNSPLTAVPLTKFSLILIFSSWLCAPQALLLIPFLSSSYMSTFSLFISSSFLSFLSSKVCWNCYRATH